MSLVNLQTILQEAQIGEYAVGNFDIFNLEMLKGVIQAAEEGNSPVILAYGEGFNDYVNLDDFAPMLISMAKKASVPVVVHLDHAIKFATILKAIHYGFTSVMVDASDQIFSENVQLTQKVIEICKTFNISVEAELGHVSGLGSMYQSDDYIYTDVKEAMEFVHKTGVNALAVAIGTVHGVYKKEPKLNYERLQQIKKAVDVPLVLHGGSGLSEDDFRETIRNGISKINIFTDLTLEAMKSISTNDNVKKLAYMDQCLKFTESVKQETLKKMNIFGSIGKAG